MTNCIIVQTSIDSKEAAQKIADSVVGQRLAACCWVSGPIRSTYWWQGAIEQAEEWVCQIKTREELYSELEAAIRAVHSYDEPEIVATLISDGSPGYLSWIVQETTKQ